METLRELYKGDTTRAHRFRYGLLIMDLLVIVYVVATSFVDLGRWIAVIDVILGVLILADFVVRIVLEHDRGRFLLRPATWADAIAAAAFLAPFVGDDLGFLRVLRTLRLLHTYEVVQRLRKDHAFFRRHQDLTLAVVNLAVFLFIMTGLIYVTQHQTNPDIGNYADALYFTVTTLTTTGFGDITLEGTPGRMLAVIVMIIGVSLFLRLLQVLFRPAKVRLECASCGLLLHDPDAVHCKHCGAIMHIETEGML